MTVTIPGALDLTPGRLARQLARVRRMNQCIIERDLGPRVVGKWYHNGYWGEDYLVLAINVDLDRGDWSITVANATELATGLRRTHRTAWDAQRDRPVLAGPVNFTKNYGTLDVCWTHRVVHRSPDGIGAAPCADQHSAWGFLPWSDLRERTSV